MFYIMSTDHRVIEVDGSCPTEDELRDLSHECAVDLYVIEGERIGLEYTRPVVDPLEEGAAQMPPVPVMGLHAVKYIINTRHIDALTGTPCPPIESEL